MNPAILLQKALRLMDVPVRLGNVPDNGLGAIEVLNYNALAVAPFDAVCM